MLRRNCKADLIIMINEFDPHLVPNACSFVPKTNLSLINVKIATLLKGRGVKCFLLAGKRRLGGGVREFDFLYKFFVILAIVYATAVYFTFDFVLFFVGFICFLFLFNFNQENSIRKFNPSNLKKIVLVKLARSKENPTEYMPNGTNT